MFSRLRIIVVAIIFVSLFYSDIMFGKESVNCSAGRHWVRAHFRRSYIRANGTLVSSSQVVAHCADDPKGYAFWKPKLKQGLPVGWPLLESAKRWNDDEIERVLEALSFLPEALWSNEIQGIYRANKSKDYPNPATSKQNEIVLYDEAFVSKSNLARILAHELAHIKYRNFPIQTREDYNASTGWYVVRQELDDRDTGKYIVRKDGFVEEDGRIYPEEDFSNNIEYFLFNPEKLKEKTPHAHRWIMENFGAKLKLEDRRNAHGQ